MAAVASNFLIDPELDAFGFHLLDAAIDVRLLQLEIRNAIAQQATHTIALFEDHDIMSDARELLRRGQTGRAGADDGDALAGLDLRRLRHDPALLPAFIDDRMLDRLDADRLGVDVERAGGFARRRTDPAGKIREIVGRVQNRQSLLPISPVDQVVPVGNDVVDRAARITERDTTVHAACALDAGLLVSENLDELAVVLQTRSGGLGGLRQTSILDESGWLAHAYAASSCFCAASSVSTRRYSCGIIFTKRPRYLSQSFSKRWACRLPVKR